MPFDDIFTDLPSASPETGMTFLRHALKVWAREQGLPEDNLGGVVDKVLAFASTTIDATR